MSTPFIAEIKIIAWNYPPKGWAFCNGQLLPINQNQALFSLLGTTYGGDGRTNFALPDFRGRAPVHVGQGIVLGQRAGEEFHTLNTGEMPAHNHQPSASITAADQATLVTPPGNTPNILASVIGNQYAPLTALTTLIPDTISNIGGSQPHENRQPYLVLNFVIALQGIFPSQN
ncbi:MAG: tail fiber protein [Tahibacter sp.]